MADSLVRAFAAAGTRFADRLRALLPVVLTGTTDQQDRARTILQREADRASSRMKQGAKVWLKNDLPKAVEAGQRTAARQLGVKFGGVNTRLVESLARDISPKLAQAAESTRPFLAKTLREVTAVRAELLDGVDRELAGLNLSISESLSRGAISRDDVRQATKRLLRDTGLTKGDQVLFLSGRSMEAKAYSELVVRTRRSEAISQAKWQEYTDQGVEYIITSQHSGVKEDDICSFLQGKVWAMGPNPYDIPELPPEYGLPPWHPNCLHTFAPFIPELRGGERALDRAAESHADDAEALGEWGGKTSRPAGEE